MHRMTLDTSLDNLLICTAWQGETSFEQTYPEVYKQIQDAIVKYKNATQNNALFAFSTFDQSLTESILHCNRPMPLPANISSLLPSIEAKEETVIRLKSVEKPKLEDLSSCLKSINDNQQRRFLQQELERGNIKCKLQLSSSFYKGEGKLQAEMAHDDGWRDSWIYLLASKRDSYELDHLLQAWPFDDEEGEKLALYKSLVNDSGSRIAFYTDAVSAADQHRQYLDFLICDWGKRHQKELLDRIYITSLLSLQTYHQAFIECGKTNAQFAERMLTGCAIDLDRFKQLRDLSDYLWALPDCKLPEQNEASLIQWLKDKGHYSGFGNTYDALTIFVRCGFITWDKDEFARRKELLVSCEDGYRVLCKVIAKEIGEEITDGSKKRKECSTPEASESEEEEASEASEASEA